MGDLETKTKKVSKWPIYGLCQMIKAGKDREYSLKEGPYHEVINGIAISKETAYHGIINGVILGGVLGCALVKILNEILY